MLGQEVDRAQDNFWTESSFSYKFYLITTTTLFLLSFLSPTLAQLFLDTPYLTLPLHPQKLFLSFLTLAPKLTSLLTLLFSFLWLHSLLIDHEECTVYKVVEVVLINFQVHLVFNGVGFGVMWGFDGVDDKIMYGYGWFGVILVYEFRRAVLKPDANRKFCFLPFTIKGKYYPFVVTLVVLALSQQVLCILAALSIGVYQQLYKKQMLIRLPYKFYHYLQKCIPEAVKSRYGFVRLESNLGNVLEKCWGGKEGTGGGRGRGQGIVFMVNQGVELSRGRERGDGKESYRRYWHERNQEILSKQSQQTQTQTNPSTAEPAPQPTPIHLQDLLPQPQTYTYSPHIKLEALKKAGVLSTDRDRKQNLLDKDEGLIYD